MRSASAEPGLVGHDVKTAPEMGWASKTNGELLTLAAGEFDVFLTVDRNLSYQQFAEPLRINDVVEWQILKGLGLPLGTADVVRFERAEMDKLVTLMFSTTVFGWSVGEDLYVVPDHARYIVQTDHHNVVHVSCRSPADVNEWVRQMEERGFALPDEVPDSTFKRPDWMRAEPQS